LLTDNFEEQVHVLFSLPIMPPPTQFSEFHPFPRLPPEIRDYIWKICVTDYPARIVDLREYRLPDERKKEDLKATTSPNSGKEKKEIVGYKSRTPAPTLLYICRDSRDIAQETYTKAFGTADMPAQTWIDFDKDILYIFEMRELSNDPYRWYHFSEEGYKINGPFFNEYNQDIQKVKDLAVNGPWEPLWGQFLYEVLGIARQFVNLERFTVIDAQHASDLTADLVFATSNESLNYSAKFRDSNYFHHLRDFRKYMSVMRDWLEDWAIIAWFGSLKLPRFEFEILMERSKQNCITSPSDIRPERPMANGNY